MIFKEYLKAYSMHVAYVPPKPPEAPDEFECVIDNLTIVTSDGRLYFDGSIGKDIDLCELISTLIDFQSAKPAKNKTKKKKGKQ